MFYRLRKTSSVLPVAVYAICCPGTLSGQTVHVGTPVRAVQGGFFERFGTVFDARLPSGGGVVGLDPQGHRTPNGGIPVRFGAPAWPPFGGHDPAGDARLGFGLAGGLGGLGIGLAAGQGSTRSMRSVTPSITFPSGGGGLLWNTIQRPFVSGIVPVVAGGNSIQTGTGIVGQIPRRRDGRRPRSVSARSAHAPAAKPTTSPARHGDLSLADIRRQQAIAGEPAKRQLDELLKRAVAAEAAHKYHLAAHLYDRAARGASQEDQAAYRRRAAGLREKIRKWNADRQPAREE